MRSWEKRFAKVVLEPWVGDDDSDIRDLYSDNVQREGYPGLRWRTGPLWRAQNPPPEVKVHNPLRAI